MFSSPLSASGKPPSTRGASALTVQQWLGDGDEIALLDVREHGQYGEGHPFFAVHAPYSRLETEVARLVPRRTTRIVLIDDGIDGDALARRAAVRLQAIRYTNVSVLEGGTPAWAHTGRTLFQGVNLPSKTFGEVLEKAFDVPHMDARTLAARMHAGEPLILLDGRTLEEHRRMTLPGAIPVPNGELALRWPELVKEPSTPVVIHCAGRTRSIVGAQILRELGLPNPVFALENGTQGWALAGIALERGSNRSLPPAPAAGSAAWRAAKAAVAASAHAAAPVLSQAQAQAWVDDTDHTTFVFDVRTAEEFAAGSLPHARHAPGGQLLQATDLKVGVRHARVLLLDDDGIRAPVIAGWLRRLGLDAASVQGGIRSGLRLPQGPGAPACSPLPRHEAAALASFPARDDPGRPVVFDLRASQAYRHGHAADAQWSIRPRLVADVRAATSGDTTRPVLLLANDESTALCAAQDLREAGWNALSWAPADATRAAGWPQERTPDTPSNAESIDYLFFVHDRHDGNLEAARRYLEWETALVAQCAPDELSAFRVPLPSPR